MKKGGHVYILASKQNGTLYIGVTTNLPTRIDQHKAGTAPGFTSQYKVHKLVWHEEHPTIEEAIKREKQLKAWNRSWKLELIEKDNPEWQDLSNELI